ncbi:MAG: ROK family protein, partial [Candidatus Sumerlaeota bacterium]|nr:ROK family protein [Candidatus Sumerlaeota bacterium]
MNAIRVRSPLARVELAESLGLDKKSITNLLDDLLKRKVVAELDLKRRKRGRPMRLLAFNTDKHAVMGIAIRETEVEGVVTDYYGKARHQCAFPFRFGAPRQKVLELVRRAYDYLASVEGAKIDVVGMSFPGIVVPATGWIQAAVNLPSFVGTNLLNAVRGFVREPLCFEVASRSMALAEKWCGEGAAWPSFILVDLSVGVGVGIVQERRLVQDLNGAVMHEAGHIRIEAGGRLCRCGNRGCLEAYLSERALLHDLRQAGVAVPARLADLKPTSEAARRILREAGYHLGVGLSYLINIVAPPLVLLNGGLMAFEDLVMPEILR